VRAKTGFDVRYENGLVSIGIREPHDAVVAISSIDQSSMVWKDLRTRRDTLEDIFIKLVGGSLEEGGTIKASNYRTAQDPGVAS
jgi:hypothetical protein